MNSYNPTDKHGNVWQINAATGQQTLIQAKSPQAAAAARADIRAFVAARHLLASEILPCFSYEKLVANVSQLVQKSATNRIY